MKPIIKNKTIFFIQFYAFPLFDTKFVPNCIPAPMTIAKLKYVANCPKYGNGEKLLFSRASSLKSEAQEDK
jgi:hypothetical protein